MTLDTVTLSAAAVLVVVTAAAVFIAETLVRKDTGAGRVWALAYLSAVLTACCYLIWTVSPQMWWAVAFGNGAHVAGIGLMWLGCRRFNRMPMRAPSMLLALIVIAVVVAAFVDGPSAGDWGGSPQMFAALALVAAAGTFESLRGEMRRHRNAVALAIALGVVCAYNATRVVVVSVDGVDGEFFNDWFGARTTAIISIVLMIVSVVAASVLRAGRARLPGVPVTSVLAIDEDGVLVADAFVRGMERRLERAASTRALMGVITTKIDDLPQIATAFGTSEAADLHRVWRAAVQQHAPMSAILGDDGPEGMLMAIHPQSVAEAERSLAHLRRGIADAFIEADLGVIPVVEVGMALTDTCGYDIHDLIGEARRAQAVSR